VNTLSVPELAKLRSGVGWSLAAALLVAYAAMLRRYSVNFPYADDFTQLLAVPHYFALSETLSEKLKLIFGLSTEHRIAMQRLMTLAQSHFLGRIDFRGLMYVGSALLMLAGMVLISTVVRDARPLFAAIAAAWLLSPANHEAALWATGALGHFGTVGFAFAALSCLSRPGIGWQLAAGVLAVAAACTSAGALMVFPAATLLLGLMGRWRPAITWALFGAALFGVYFIGYEAQAHQASLATYLRDPIVPLRFFFMAVGTVGIVPPVALALGVALCLFWAWLVALGRTRSLPPVLFAWSAFLLLSFAAITWGRASFGDQGALASRYRVYSELMLLVSLAALVAQSPHGFRMPLLGAALAAGLVWFVAFWRHDLPHLEWFYASHRTNLDYYVAEGHSAPNEFPPAAYRDFMLVAAKGRGVYDPARVANAPRHFVVESRALDAARPVSMWMQPPVAGKRTLVVNVYGPGHESDGVIWLESGEQIYRGRLQATPLAPLALGERTGFLWGVYTLAGVPPGRYRLGVGADDANAPSVVWSSYCVDVE
jgi:hypothetical protein